MIIKLADREMFLLSASVLRTMDTGTDEFRCVIPEVDEKLDQELYDLVKPRSLAKAEVTVNGEKKITGHKWITAPALTNKDSAVELTGYSKTFPLTISNPKSQRAFQNSSLIAITNEFIKVFGISVTENAPSELLTEEFEDEKIAAQDIVFSFLQNLARQRSVLTSSDKDGNLEYLQANTSQNIVGSIVEGKDGVIPMTDDFKARFDDTKIFQTYQAVNDSPYAFLIKEPGGISKDERIKVPTFKTIVTSSLIEGAGQKAVDFARNQTIAQSLSMPFRVNGWIAPNGELWQENTLVSVESPILFVPNGFTFLIRAVQYDLGDDGEKSILWLVPPSLYTGEPIDEPWG